MKRFNGSIFAALFVLGTGVLQAQPAPPSSKEIKIERVDSRINGTLMNKGKTVTGEVITTCAEFGAVPGIAPSGSICNRPIEMKTPADGEFSFLQFTGQPTFTCYTPCAKDPSSLVWFDVSFEGKRWRAYLIEFGILKNAELVCHLDKGSRRANMPRWPKELLEYAPQELSCEVKQWSQQY